ncbi:hypothetical protein N5K27_22375 [Pigmentiphaga sp. GD03639]|uniref:hypothetical protein n=1 Tax=Pigmentiphaga sp. GD03639 TaxID=2975354 RepID=UPI00244C7B43|nr:hypothetical protein [Pigmentiphaga sp. GD03639]MDH2239058.1 hypothetical protein [Pigmentiphaga sp. GD03639]
MIPAWLRYGTATALGGVLVWFAVAQPQIAALERDLARQQADVSRQQAKESAAALSDLETMIRNIRAAADGYQAQQAILAPRIDALAREIKNAPKPLPVDCRPDDFRVRNLRAAVDAANEAGSAPAAGQPSGRAVPAGPVP